MKNYLVIILLFLANIIFSQPKTGLYPIYFETNTQKQNFQTAYNLNGYNYVDSKHPMIAFVKQDTSWHFFNYTNKTFLKLPGRSVQQVIKIIDTIPNSGNPLPILIGKFVNGTDTVGIYSPYSFYENLITSNRNQIGVFFNPNGDPTSVYESLSKCQLKGDTSIQFTNELGTSNYLQIDKTIYGYPVSSTNPINGQVLKFNGSQYVPADDEVSGGTGVDGVVTSAAITGTTSKTLTLTRSNSLPNITANFTDNVNDADASPTNEIQTLSKDGSIITLSNSGGSVTLGDDSPTNEIQTLSKVGNSLSISEGNTITLGDENSSNELQTITKNGNTVTLSQGGGSFTDEVNDADYDPTNENQTVSAGFGIDVTQNVQNYQVKADTAELASYWGLKNKKDYFNFDWSVIKNLTANSAVALKQLTGGLNTYTIYTTVIGSYLEFIQGYIDQKNTGSIAYSIKVYKRSEGSSTLINTISVNSTGIGKYYYYYDYSSSNKFREGDEFYITVQSDANINEVLVNYTIYYSRDPYWEGETR